MIRSIELNWLSRLDKGIPLPTLIIVDKLINREGFYCYPHKYGGYLSMIDYNLDPNEAVICIPYSDEPKKFESDMAHEWRHHWQWFHGGWHNKTQWKNCKGNTRKNRIINYVKQPHELDALKFEVYMMKRDYRREVLSWVTAGESGNPSTS